MHAEVHEPNFGKCPKCGMDLLPEGTRFAMIRHLVGNPLMLIVMVAAMLWLMAALMMMMR